MKITHKSSIETVASDNLPDNIDKFDYKITSGLNDFNVVEVEKKVFQLESANVFDQNILALLKTPIADITFIDIIVYVAGDSGDTSYQLPFQLKIDGVYKVKCSRFTLVDIRELLWTSLEVYGVAITGALVANLVITVGSNNKNI